MTPPKKVPSGPLLFARFQSKDYVGAEEGIWMIVEVLNVPWEDEMLNFRREVTKDALFVIQKAVGVRQGCQTRERERDEVADFLWGWGEGFLRPD